MLLKIIFCASVFIVIASSYPLKPTNVGCMQCHSVDSNKINVHLIAHSHDDVGWLKTVDDYFWGQNMQIQYACVKDIISTMVDALKNNTDRRYIQVETAFFWKWWETTTNEARNDFVNLVNKGQLEMVNAAWSMNDEAVTHYHSIIDHFTLGLRTVNDTVGKCGIPRIGWQIDPFGHSREQASLFSQLGFDGVFFARIDFEDKKHRIKNKNMEVIWRGSASLNNTNIFTNIFIDSYYAPGGFCFDIECIGSINDHNIEIKVQQFNNYAGKYAEHYKTNNILIPIGGDFHFQLASYNFNNIDRLIKGFANHPVLNVIYSTPSCYLQAVHNEARLKDVEFNLKTDDFFPYGSDFHSYWTGYFTSRPTAKRLERTSHNILQTAKQLATFGLLKSMDWINDLTALKQAMGVMQHHDAITGTAKEAVANDYVRLLTNGIHLVESDIALTVLELLSKRGGIYHDFNLQHCLLTNVSICAESNKDKFLVTVYNPLERPVTHYVRLPVSEKSYQVTGFNGEETIDILNAIDLFPNVKYHNSLPSPRELVFAAKDVPGFGIKLFYVKVNKNLDDQTPPQIKTKLGNKKVGFEIDTNGLLKSVTINGVQKFIKQEFMYYKSSTVGKMSGAYIFRPTEKPAIKVSEKSVKTTITIGNLVDEVHQHINEWLTQIIRVYKNEDFGNIEFDWLVGPIPLGKDFGREIITRFTIQDFDNSNTFYTDSNGREMIKRVLNTRYDYNYTHIKEPVASNYYPVTTRICIRDNKKQEELAILNDRAQGGSSLANGQIELMVHRRMLKDDNKGLEEALNEIEFELPLMVRGKHYLTFGSLNKNSNLNSKSVTQFARKLAVKKLLMPTILVGETSESLDDIKAKFKFVFEGVKKPLPQNVHILTLEPLETGNTFILRLENIMEIQDNPNIAVVDLSKLFTLFEISEIKETTLGANQWLDEYNAEPKYAWNIKKEGLVVNKPAQYPIQNEITQITLDPMQIRTFIIKIKPISVNP